MIGVKLGMKQMVGKDDKTKKVQNKNKNKKNKENENKNTTPSINGIKKYFVRKQENNDDDNKISPGTDSDNKKKISPLKKTSNDSKEDKLVRGLVNKFEHEESTRSMKKTFTTSSKNVKSVSKKIEDFNKISSNSVKCLMCQSQYPGNEDS